MAESSYTALQGSGDQNFGRNRRSVDPRTSAHLVQIYTFELKSTHNVLLLQPEIVRDIFHAFSSFPPLTEEPCRHTPNRRSAERYLRVYDNARLLAANMPANGKSPLTSPTLILELLQARPNDIIPCKLAMGRGVE